MSDDIAICRVCVQECTSHMSLFKQGVILGDMTTLADLLNYCTNLEANEDETLLPKQMCTKCVQSLARAYAFKKLAIDGDAFLRNIHIQEEVETDELCEITELQSKQSAKTEPEDELQSLANAAEMKRDMDEMRVSVVLTEPSDNDDDMEQQYEENHVEPQQHADHGQLIVDHVEEFEDEIQEYEYEEEYQDEDKYEDDQHSEEDHIKITNDCQVDEKCYEIDDDGNMYELLPAIKKLPSIRRPAPKRLRMDEDSTNDNLMDEQQFMEVQAGKKKPFAKRNRTNEKVVNPSLQCKICSKQLSNSNSFKYHMLLHSDATPYLCSLCGEGFKTPNAYDGHMAIHNPNNPNKCKICGKTYRQLSSLRVHMVSHTGEKPFECDMCDKRFSQKSGYKKHLLTHTGEKPHSCDICGRTFRYSSNLFAHKRCHTGEKNHHCDHCNKSFAFPEQLKRHLQQHHSIEEKSKSFNRRQAHQEGVSEVTHIDVDRVSKSKVVELL